MGLCRFFFRFFAFPRCNLNFASKKHRKKVRKSRVLASQTPPKTRPKSAAPLSVPRRVGPICFNVQDLIDLSTYRGAGKANPPNFRDFLGSMLALFSLLGASLPHFAPLAAFVVALGRFWCVPSGAAVCAQHMESF